MDRFQSIELLYYCVHLQDTQNYGTLKSTKEFYSGIWFAGLHLGNEIKQTLRIADEQRAPVQRL